MAASPKPDLREHSGWCLKWPVSEYNEAEHDKCPMHFSTRSCTCPCGHKGERSLESRGTTFQPYIPPKKQQLKLKEEDKDEDD